MTEMSQNYYIFLLDHYMRTSYGTIKLKLF